MINAQRTFFLSSVPFTTTPQPSALKNSKISSNVHSTQKGIRQSATMSLQSTSVGNDSWHLSAVEPIEDDSWNLSEIGSMEETCISFNVKSAPSVLSLFLWLQETDQAAGANNEPPKLMLHHPQVNWCPDSYRTSSPVKEKFIEKLMKSPPPTSFV